MKKIIALVIMLVAAGISQGHAGDTVVFNVGVHYASLGDASGTGTENIHGAKLGAGKGGHGISAGVTKKLGDSDLFIKGELINFGLGFYPALGVGIDADVVKVSVGMGRLKEEAFYAFGGIFHDAESATSTSYSYVEIEVKSIFIRYMTYDLEAHFTGYEKNYVYDPNVPQATTSASVSLDRDVLMVGYRFKF